MNLITITNEIKKDLNMSSVKIKKNSYDFMVMVKKMNEKRIFIACPASFDLQYGDIHILSFTINNNDIDVKIEIIDFTNEDGFNVAECRFLEKLPIPLNSIIVKWNKINDTVDERKEERILLTDENINLLGIKPLIYLEFNDFEYPAYIKDLSFSACRVITSNKLLNENGASFLLVLIFGNPILKCIFNTSVIRKEALTINEKNISQIVFRLEGNERYKQRLSDFFEKEKERHCSNLFCKSIH